MNTSSSKTKVIATLAVVGTVAAVAALVGMNASSSASSGFMGTRNLAQTDSLISGEPLAADQKIF
jgi:hypothetical protein